MKHNLLRYSLLLILLAGLNASCKDDTLLSSDIVVENGTDVYVSIVVNTEGSGVSRAGTTPTPGEDGDGLQDGTNDENRVHDLNVFFFHTTDGKGLNTTDTQVNIVSTYFSQLTTNGSGYATEAKEIEGLQIGQSYNVLVLANIGSQLSITTLEGLRTYTVQQPIVQTNYFVMASSETREPIEIQANSKNNPTVVSVNIERLAARVDCHWENSYSIGNDNVEITGAMLVNKYAGNTYAFKRVTASTTDFTFDYLGTEKKDEQNHAANYVIGPKTLEPPQTDIANFYSTYFPTYNWSATDENWKTPSTTTTSSQNDVTYYLLDYTSENIVEAEYNQKTCATYCTGIVFKAKYQPADITTNGTFYRYNGKFYASLDDIMNEYGFVLSEYNYSQFGITKYQDGICYYTYFIKHAEDGDDTTVSPMEYAIVRNNIYQVKVTGINDIGTVTPTDYRLNLECTVAEWIQEDEITIDFNNNYNGTIAATSIKKATFTDSTVPEENGEWVIVAYSQDNVLREPQFSFYMETPVGVGWTAHLTNPDDFEFVSDYQGIGGGNPVTLQIRPRRAFEEGVIRTTEMYITTDLYNEPVAFNQGTETFPGSEQAIRIRQVSTTEYDTSKDNT